MATLRATWWCLLALIPTLIVPGSSAVAKPKPEYDMGLMQMVLLVRNPEAKIGTEDSLEVLRAHRARIDSLVARGDIAFSGVGAAEDTLQEILVLKSDSLELAQRFARELPTVRSGLFEARHLTWFAARNHLKPASKPLKRSDYQFGILVRGPKWTGEVTPESKKIQEGHMANINRLAEEGKLVLAGPFEQDGRERGVFIFKVATLEEAQALTNTDPAVKAGRLVIELHRTTVPDGVLPK